MIKINILIIVMASNLRDVSYELIIKVKYFLDLKYNYNIVIWIKLINGPCLELNE